MKKTKLLALLMAALLVFAVFAACGDTDEPTPPPVDSGTTEEPPVDGGDVEEPSVASGDFTVDVFIYDFADTFIGTVRDALAAELSAAGVTHNIHDAASGQDTQLNQIETAITQGTDMLLVNIVDTGAEDVALDIAGRADAAGIPVVFFNREVSDNVINSGSHVVYVGTDAPEAGYMQGELIFNAIRDNIDEVDRDGDGYIQYIMFKGELGNPEAQGRTEFSVQEANRLLSEAGLPTLVFYDANNTDLFIGANWSTAEAQNAMNTALSTHPVGTPGGIELVIANNDDMALGAIEALAMAGFNTGDGDSIPVFGVDATSVARDAIAAGRMTGTIEQSATGMASHLIHLVNNAVVGNALMDDTGAFNVDAGVDKIRVPHAMVN